MTEKDKIQNVRDWAAVLDFPSFMLGFEFVSDFDIRISKFLSPA